MHPLRPLVLRTRAPETCVHVCIHVQMHGCACFPVTASCATYRWRSSVQAVAGVLTAAPGKGRLGGLGLWTLLGCSDLTRPKGTPFSSRVTTYLVSRLCFVGTHGFAVIVCQLSHILRGCFLENK